MRLAALLLPALLAACLLGRPAGAAVPGHCRQDGFSTARGLLTPLYIYPEPGAWDWYEAAAAKAHRNAIPALAIANQGSGRWDFDQAYHDQLARMRDRRLAVLAYVAEGYGTRPLAQIRADIDRLAAHYGAGLVCGVFIDELHPGDGAAMRRRHARIVAHIRARLGRDAIIAANPGTGLASAAALAAPGGGRLYDLVVAREDGAAKVAGHRVPAWQKRRAQPGFAFIAHGATKEGQVAAVLEAAAAQGIRFLHVTQAADYDARDRWIGAVLEGLCRRGTGKPCRP